MKNIFLTAAAIAICAAMTASAEGRETKIKWGCEWIKAENGNYWSKTDGGCKHWAALGYGRLRDMLGKDTPAVEDPEEPSEPSETEDKA